MIYNLTNKMERKVLRAIETYLLPKWAKCTFDWKTIYEFLGMDWMYWRFKKIDTWEIGYSYWKFIYNEKEDLYEYFG